MIELVTLGRPSILRDRVPLHVPPDSPEFLLLVRLSLHGPASRDRLGDLLWPEDPLEDRGRLLDTALDRIRELAGPDVLRADDEVLEVDPGRVTADVERFREAVAGDRPRDALALYRGPFLEDMEFSELPEVAAWVEETRRTLAGMARRARDQVPWGDDPPADLWPRIVQEIRSRRVFHVAILYLGFAWGSLEVCSTLVQMELLGNVFFVALLAFHLVSFPLVVTATWLLEGTRAGDEVPALPDVIERSGLRAAHLLALLAVLTAGSAVGWVVLQWGSGEGSMIASLRAELPAEKHLAVLPFRVLGDDPQAQELAEGLMETLTSQLTQMEGLRGNLAVVSSFDVRGRQIQSPQAAREAFGANLAVTGALQLAGDSIQATVNLVDAHRARQYGSFILSESRSEMHRLQSGILEGLRALLDLELEASEEATLAAGPTESAQAYALQVRARGHLQRYERAEHLDQALELFREALVHDSLYVLALAGIGEAHKRKYDLSSDAEELERARDAVLAALELDEGIAAVHVSLGLIHSAFGRHEEALDAFGRALDLEPYSVDALLGMADAYREMGRMDRAEPTYVRAQNARPGDWRSHNGLGVLYDRQGRYEEALEQFRRVVELYPDHTRGWSNVGVMHVRLGRPDLAEEAMERSVSIAPTLEGLSNLAGLYFYVLQDYERAAEVYEQVVELNERDYRAWYNLANTYRYLDGAEDRAREAFRNALERARAAQEFNRRDPGILLTLASSHAYLGDPARARVHLREALDLAPGDVGVLFRAGDVHESLGDREEAIRLIEAALEGGYPREQLEGAPGLEDLRADPRFRGGSEDGGGE